MKLKYSYQTAYIKFFLHRSHVCHFDNIQEIEKQTYNDPRISKIIKELQDWPCYAITSHKNVDHPLHKLSLLAELGFNKSDPGIAVIVDKILSHQSDEGPLQLLIEIPKHFGGSGKPELSWVMSDAPVLLYAAIKLNNNEIIAPLRKGLDYIAGLVADNGWRCTAAKELGKFHGPGRKEDPCPYATMFALKMLALTGEQEYPQAKQAGLDSLFNLWDRRKETKPYLFGMGTDFRKLKLPFVWYDILNMVDTLSMYPQAVQDKRFKEWITSINNKETAAGFIPESIYLKANEWDFGQKKKPSEYMNAVVERINFRLSRQSTA